MHKIKIQKNMQRLYIISKMNAIIMSMVLVLLVSCQVNPNSSLNDKNYIVQLDILSESETTDLQDSDNIAHQYNSNTYSANDILALQVYSRTISSNAKYAPYAYGIYNNPTQIITIPMTQGQEYKIEATLIKDGNTVIHRNNQSNFLSPLIVNGICFMSQIELNKINISRECVMQGIGKSTSTMASDRKTYNRPMTDRYHGISSDFDPSKSQKLSIKLNRVIFGIQISTEKQIEGSINLQIAQAPMLKIDASSNPNDTYIFTMSNHLTDETAWTQDNYSENIEIKTTWNKTNGEVINLPTRTLSFKRKHYYKLNLRLNDIQHDTNPNIEIEDDTLIDGGNITLD